MKRRRGQGADTDRDEAPRVAEGDDPDRMTATSSSAKDAILSRSGGIPRFSLTILDGPKLGQTWHSTGPRCSIGSHASNDLVVDDPTMSRFHSEIEIDGSAACIRDLASRNGTILDGVLVLAGFLRAGSLVRMGRTVARFELDESQVELPIAETTRIGNLVGASVAMRRVFALLERVAASDATVLIEGETGTGKDLAADAIHRESKRKGPFIVVDCSALLDELLESELFGHEKGAFTGAVARRIGAFEEAQGGTVFLDEIGELPADLQPKLLRVLEQRQIRRVGSNVHQPVDVRVIAATNRDLRAEVNAGRFRSDLFFRLAVVRVGLPPLRSRPEDIPLIVTTLLDRLGAPAEVAKALTTPAFLASLQRAAWVGNVREFRNYIERCIVFQQSMPLGEPADDSSARGADVDLRVPFIESRARAIAKFERDYLEALMKAHGETMQGAVAVAGIDRVYLYKLLRRHSLQKKR